MLSMPRLSIGWHNIKGSKLEVKSDELKVRTKKLLEVLLLTPNSQFDTQLVNIVVLNCMKYRPNPQPLPC
jgi:hypothetical protein